jgi:hypothetical protein
MDTNSHVTSLAISVSSSTLYVLSRTQNVNHVMVSVDDYIAVRLLMALPSELKVGVEDE